MTRTDTAVLKARTLQISSYRYSGADCLVDILDEVVETHCVAGKTGTRQLLIACNKYAQHDAAVHSLAAGKRVQRLVARKYRNMSSTSWHLCKRHLKGMT